MKINGEESFISLCAACKYIMVGRRQIHSLKILRLLLQFIIYGLNNILDNSNHHILSDLNGPMMEENTRLVVINALEWSHLSLKLIRLSGLYMEHHREAHISGLLSVIDHKNLFTGFFTIFEFLYLQEGFYWSFNFAISANNKFARFECRL